jgi:DNA-binding MarR family transcriptional regulator
MSQVDVETSIGYALKRTTASLRAAMDERLRELGLTVAQYSSLELLARYPGISNADLARGVFVSRQATHQLLSGLKRLELIEVDGTGREQRLRPTPKGTRTLRKASATVAEIEEQMLSGLNATQRKALRNALNACAEALS